jgi:para-nitrobenzyl esterase
MAPKNIVHTNFSRRALLKSSLVGGGAALAGSLFRGFLPNAAWAADIAAKYETAVVETESGKIRGVIQAGVQTFRGIPYGASTAGANRFMAPRKPEPWTGVRDAFQNGPSAPQLGGAPNPIVLGHTAPTFQSEDCLVLNVFTPALNGKRPVMVWLHGGGYAGGAGSAHSFDGNYLARGGDVVVVSVNHRLNVFGYLFLAGVGGEKYTDSGDAGLLDVVAALQWTHDNIARFGGDPGNVTLFGQSGGGAKVSTLLGMPATKGLVHKAIIESGSALKGVSQENASKTTERLLAKLSLQPNQVDELQKLPMEKLLAAIDARGQAPAGGAGFNFAPVVDGKNLPRDPWDPTAPDVSADVPVIIGSVNTEGTFFMRPDNPQTAPLYSLDDAGLKAQLTQRYGEAADKLIEAYRKEAPDASASKIFFEALAFPGDAIKQGERKFAQGKAPVYMYLFAWETPVDGGRRHSPHTIELPFVFDNPQEQPDEVGNGPDLQPLADRVSGAWAAFARTGSPNTPLTPKWPAYNPDQRATMIINDEWKVVNDPRHDVRMIMDSLKGTRNS